MAIKDPTVTAEKKPDASKNEALNKEEAAAAAATKEAEAEAAKKAAEEELAEAEEASADAPAGKELYRLKRRYWNGRKLIDKGEMYYFPKGEAPATAVNEKSGKTGAQERQK